jgi:hypothetical protein
MGSSAVAAAAALNPFMGIIVTENLGKNNHAMWKAQILAAVRGARMVGHLTGASPAPAEEIDGKDSAGKDAVVPNPAYEEWFSRDQQVLSFVLGSLGREVLAQVAAQDTAAGLWAAIEEMYCDNPPRENTVLSPKTDPPWSLSNSKVSSCRWLPG